MRQIGIIGGMGPAATAALHQEIISLCQQEYGCVEDEDFPPIIISEIPIKDFGAEAHLSEELYQELEKRVQQLAHDGCEVLVIDCNSVHVFIQRLRKTISATLLSIIEEISLAIPERISTIGILGSQTTHDKHIYEQVLKQEIVQVDDEQELQITKIIHHLMGGTQDKQDVERLNEYIELLEQQQAELIILACTELSLIKKELSSVAPIMDSTRILAQAAIQASRSQNM